jgi:hypothetical protein
MSMEDPSTLLTLFAAVFRPTTPPAFGELSGILFPLATFVIGTLPYTASAVVFAAEIAHDDAGPVLHLLAMMSHSKLFYQWEDVVIVWEKIFFFLRIAGGMGGSRRGG